MICRGLNDDAFVSVTGWEWNIYAISSERMIRGITRLTIISRTRKIPSHEKKGFPRMREKGQPERDRAREITWQNSQTRELRPRSNCEYDYA